MEIDISVLLDAIPENALVLDLGGWNSVFPRANVVVDLSPYETRNIKYPDVQERFSRDSWIVADFCSPKFWSTVADKQFDFIIISHTLEDVRDPLYVCSQMIRCGKAGYIEVPSRFRECSKLNRSDPFSGYDHHRWIVEPNEDVSGLIFKAKLSWAHASDFLGDEHRHYLSDYFYFFDGYFWKDSFSYVEHFHKGFSLETRDLEHHFAKVIAGPKPRKHLFQLKENSSSPRDGDCLWISEYRLGIEDDSGDGISEVSS